MATQEDELKKGVEKSQGPETPEQAAARGAGQVAAKREGDAGAALMAGEPLDVSGAETQRSGLMERLMRVRELMRQDPGEASWALGILFKDAAEILPFHFLPERKGVRPNELIEFPDGTILYRKFEFSSGHEVSIIERGELGPKIKSSLEVIGETIQGFEDSIRELRNIKGRLGDIAI